jgi:hypothetical protein
MQQKNLDLDPHSERRTKSSVADPDVLGLPDPLIGVKNPDLDPIYHQAKIVRKP